jgi:myo-inositol 2-dehydrogenase / D-chiro-inositol 1-dehydrogenase
VAFPAPGGPSRQLAEDLHSEREVANEAAVAEVEMSATDARACEGPELAREIREVRAHQRRRKPPGAGCPAEAADRSLVTCRKIGQVNNHSRDYTADGSPALGPLLTPDGHGTRRSEEDTVAGDRVRIGIIGSQFQADVLAAAIALGRHGEAVAVASPTAGHAEALARRHGIASATQDYRELLADPAVELVALAVPNHLHCEITVQAAAAGKHVMVEKPMALTLDECDQMIAACKGAGVQLFYGEELLFTPKYAKAKEMADQGAFGSVFLVKQSEMHSGPHADWFWDVGRSGGGVFMDMGCHSLAFCHWFLGRPRPVAITAHMGTYVHGARTRGDDHAVAIVEFAGGTLGHVEDSWTRGGGMDDRIEVYGTGGHTSANLMMGNALVTYSEHGYGYAAEKAPSTTGWSYTAFEELWNYGFPQELDHFARCVRGFETPVSAGEDGRAVQELLFAGYQSAGSGRRVTLPFDPGPARKPVDLWFSPLQPSSGAAQRA